jgi:hypothetical protein
VRRRTYSVYMHREPVISFSHCQFNVGVSGKCRNDSKLIDA